MTINFVEWMNYVLEGSQALPITVLVKEIFNKINDSFVTNEMKIMNMIKAWHRYYEEVYVMMQENRRVATSHYVQMYVQIEQMVVWLWGISIISNSLLACNCNVCFLQFRMQWLCWPCIQVGKYLQSLWVSFPWKQR